MAGPAAEAAPCGGMMEVEAASGRGSARVLLRADGSGSSGSSSRSEHAAPSQAYRTRALEIGTMPPGLGHILVNETAERFSFYGMKAILVVYMSQHLTDAAGRPAMSETEARERYHEFTMAVYATPVIGALSAEVLLGKYRTIMGFSLVYCGGHLALAISESGLGLVLGLALIALGSGGIKPCVSANVGDQFGEANQQLLPTAFS